jgi:hypothetical protein
MSATAADVKIYYHQKYCYYNEDCTLDVYVQSLVPLGRLSVVLQWDSTKITVSNIEDGGFLPTHTKLQWSNSAEDFAPLYCPGSTCGMVGYNYYDATDSTSGFGRIMRITFRLNATTQLGWGKCSCTCPGYTCLPLDPFAQSYDGSTTYTMSYDLPTITRQDEPLIDSDGDGIPDVVEVATGTDPYDMDSDDDGLVDGSVASEDLNDDGFVQPGETDPKDADSDDDGIFDGTEKGLTAPESGDTDLGAGHFIADADPLTTTDPTNPDSDGDGILDGIEDPNGNGAYEPELGESDPKDPGSTPPPQPTQSGVRVLLLGDDEAQVQVQAALEAAGHQVTVIDRYDEWDGVTPDVDSFQIVVLLDGEYYGYELQAAAGTALEAFVAKTCDLLITEWTAYDVEGGSKTGPIADLMPVVSPDANYDYGFTWSVAAAHPLTAGLPASWWDDAGSTYVDPKPGAIVLIRGEDQIPLLTYSNQAGGRVTHLNHDMTYTTDTIEANALQIIVNAVESATICPLFADDFENANCDGWSAVVGLVP